MHGVQVTKRPPPRPAAYHLMTAAEKQARHRNTMREPHMVCTLCEAQITVADRSRHMEACTGPREPHPLSEWIAWKAALALGVRPPTMSRWVRQGKVRARGALWSREYLRRDVERLLALRAAAVFRR